jgi:uncharacterized damage-inducible protein DinB
MSRIGAIVLAGLAMTLPVAAQQNASQAPTPAVSLRNYYMTRKGEVTKSAEKMPEEFYGLRPGQQEEVRTFGQHVAHIANFNFLWCAQARGEKNPNAGNNLEKTLHTKAEFLKALSDSYVYCDGAYNTLTDANGTEIIEITQENGRKQQVSRMALLTLNLVHGAEVYGSMATTMRIKNIVPTSSEPRPQAPSPQPAKP